MLNKKRRIKKISLIIILIIIIAIILFIIFKKDKDKLIGSWTTDGVTIYEFNNDNTGYLKVSLGKHEFTYKIEDDKLFIDFKNEKSTDSEYTYSFKDGKLILKGRNGTFTFTKNK